MLPLVSTYRTSTKMIYLFSTFHYHHCYYHDSPSTVQYTLFLPHAMVRPDIGCHEKVVGHGAEIVRTRFLPSSLM